MPFPVLPILATVVEFIIANGTRTAITKFGQQAVKQATKQMSNVQKKQAQKNILNKQGTLQADRALVNSRVEQQLARQGPAPRFNQAERIRGLEAIKVKGRNRRIEGQAPSRRFDAEGDLIEGIPLKFAEGDVVQGIGSLMMAAGDEVSSGRRPGTVGPNVQRNVPGRMTGVADKVLTGSGRPPVRPMGSMLPTQALSRMGTLGRLGGPGLAAAGAYGLYEIGKQTGFDPEQIGKAAAQIGKGIQAVVDEATEVANEIKAPIQEFVDRVVQGYQSEMQNKPTGMPMQQPNAQLQMAEGGEASIDEVQSSLNELQEQQPEIDAMNQLIASVVEMVMSGVSEEEIMQFLSSKGLDDEEIQMVLEAVAEQLMQQQGQQQDPIQAEISQMA